METFNRSAVRLALVVLLAIDAATAVMAATVTWVGGVNSSWDTATANWRTSGGADTTYANGDAVLFDESTSVSTVTLASALTPSLVTVNTSGLTYRLDGPGEITGNAMLVKSGLWILILANNNSYTGGTFIQQGFLVLGDSGNAGSIGSGSITNNGELVINRTGTLQLPNAISGKGRLTVSLAATVVLSGLNTYTNTTVVRAGNLVLNGINSGGGTITNEPSATLSGRGTNSGPVVVSGTISPGDGIGTLTTGPLTLVAGARAVVDLGEAATVGGGMNDLLVVNGNLTLNNNTLVVNVPQPPATGVPYRLINYNGVRSGIFNPTLVLNGVGLPPASVSYDDAAKAVNLTFQGASFPPQVIYREIFGSGPSATDNLPATVFDWQAFDSNGAPISDPTVNFSTDGRGIDVSNINAGPNQDGTFGVYTRGLFSMGANPSPSLALTTEFRIDPANYAAGTIVFSSYQGNAAASQSYRVLVRVGGVWYASDTSFTTAAIGLGAFAAQAELKSLTYDPAAANWWLVNFNGDYVPGATPGSGVSSPSSLGTVSLLAKASANLSGAITGFGYYGENGGGTGSRRFDSYTIVAEPLITGLNPRFSSVQFSQGNVIVRATNGPPNWTARLLASSDVAAPFSSWVGIKTGVFDGSGNLAITNAIGAAPFLYYRLQAP